MNNLSIIITLQIYPWHLGFRFKCASYLLHGTTKSRLPEATVGAFRQGEMMRNSRSIARNFNIAMEEIGRAITPESQSLWVYMGDWMIFRCIVSDCSTN